MLRKFSTRARVGFAALVAAPVAVAGLVAANVANASGPVLSTTERGLCIKSGTGEPRSLWLVAATHKCPDPYWGPASLEDAFGIEGTGTPGPAGPKGDKGDPGDSRLVFATGKATVAAGVAGNGPHVITISGMPQFSATQAKRSLADVNSELFPPDVKAVVSAPVAVAGSTTWSYTVTTSLAVVGTPSFVLSLDVIAAPIAP